MCRWAENGPQIVPNSSSIPGRDAEPASERRERALGVSGAAVETVPKPSRPKRTFSPAEKLRIVKRADACLASGKRGALEAMLRKEGIYSSLLSAWRAQLGAQGAAGLDARKPGRKPKLDAKDRRIAELTKRNADLERKLHIAEVINALQKKAHEILGIALPTLDGES
jgi:transposase